MTPETITLARGSHPEQARCWCCARYGLTTPATQKSHGVGDRASTRNDICGPCASRSATACDRAHVKAGGIERKP